MVCKYLRQIIVLIAVPVSNCFAQDHHGTFLNAYAESIQSDYTIQWSVGHLVTETFVMGDITLGSGLSQQAPIITGITEEAGSHFIVFPNPFSEILTVESPTTTLIESSISVHNLVGVSQNVSFSGVDGSRAQIMGDTLPAGVYILSIRDPRTNRITKVKIVRE